MFVKFCSNVLLIHRIDQTITSTIETYPSKSVSVQSVSYTHLPVLVITLRKVWPNLLCMQCNKGTQCFSVVLAYLLYCLNIFVTAKLKIKKNLFQLYRKYRYRMNNKRLFQDQEKVGSKCCRNSVCSVNMPNHVCEILQ